MYRLTDDICRRRLLYPWPLAGMPAILLIDLPRGSRGAGLLLGRYYSVIAETDAEIAEIETFLSQPREHRVAPDLLDRRASAVRSAELAIIRYDPPQPGWPWLSVCRWPVSSIRDAAAPADMARGCYTFEAFADPAGLEARQMSLLSSLGQSGPVRVKLISGESLPPETRT